MNHERFQVIFLSQGAHFGTLRAAQIVGRPLARTGRKNLKCTAAQTIGAFGCILNPSCNRCVNAEPAGGAARRSSWRTPSENGVFAAAGGRQRAETSKCTPPPSLIHRTCARQPFIVRTGPV